ncbi:spore cortex biosynthesis protein YabQ [Litchfieldia alkalitelluris]|uniref:spore cortex biosynthesis protein YabQ n=1 Tax=Litchfieldia alkalitelluris TaxID=304268 RepID=UPI000997ECE3|nr:spore cortex biosynthesis protein YabQ [Litchfieldia alkalitelluris]
MSLTTQFYTMMAMVGMGSWLGAALDTYGRFLKRPKRAHWVVFLNDVFFWVVQGLIIFYTLLLVNEGELRFYVFIAILCGYAAYQSMLKNWYLRVLEKLIDFAVSTFKFLAKTIRLLIIRPIQTLFQTIIVLILGLLNFLWTLTKFLFKMIMWVLKIIFLPIKWTGLLLWKLIPKPIKQVIEKYSFSFAGLFKKMENMKHSLNKFWKKIKKS